MDFYDEVKKVATELYEENGRVEGHDLDKWFEAEKIVMAQQRQQCSLQ
ncbi:MAG: DUF2934 domain-containing protein [Nitrospirae bacterium]|jgi:hypothetical protein|nr:DUF2934 domain-containing protein [Nitrospirota bacterium]